jgi:hypothetical protein
MPVIPSRGIRQGDPISPYLFLLYTEGLSCLLNARQNSGALSGIRNGRYGPTISHLLFADDSIFFAKSDPASVDALKETLNTYCAGSRQMINLQKSSVFFGSHCSATIRSSVMTKLEVQNEALQESYLGMPTHVGRSPTSTFRFLPDHMWNKANGYTERPMSRAAKETLLKSVVQAIPTHVMNCFELPVGSCDNMRGTISNAWWGVENGKKKMHWRSWEWLTTPKSLGGVGFRDMSLFNQALLGKQCWRLLAVPDSLCARVLNGRYYPNGSFWSASCPRTASYTWRSLMFGKDLLARGIRWGVGNGSAIQITKDNWIPDTPAYLVKPIISLTEGLTVDSLLNSESTGWNEDRLHQVFQEDIVRKILSIPISLHGGGFCILALYKNRMLLSEVRL